MKILVLDNYDSFTYNLVHMVDELGYKDIDVARNDAITLGEIGKYDKIILSPGPGIPSEAGIMLDLIRAYAPAKSILGICLGMQAIGEAFGARLENMADVFHGVAANIEVTANDALFEGTGGSFEAGRYHSWMVGAEDFPGELCVTAVDGDGNIMAISHREYDVRGLQFHPESVLTPEGKKMISNWLKAGAATHACPEIPAIPAVSTAVNIAAVLTPAALTPSTAMAAEALPAASETPLTSGRTRGFHSLDAVCRSACAGNASGVCSPDSICDPRVVGRVDDSRGHGHVSGLYGHDATCGAGVDSGAGDPGSASGSNGFNGAIPAVL